MDSKKRGSMNADHIRHLYEYHFTLNRKFWHFCIKNLSWKQLIGRDKISVGSIRNQFVHIMSVDERWFRGLRGKPDIGFHNPENFGKAEEIRLQWDLVEAEMRVFLDGLNDRSFEMPFQENMKVWNVLFHVVNHGTAHRAQIGARLRHLGLKPPPQDYIHFALGTV